MQSNQVGFERSFQQHLDAEQRRAVLEAIGASINPDSTLGEILDAAEALGWSEKMGELSLADLAEALLAPEADRTSAKLEASEDVDALDDDELDDDELDDDELDDDVDVDDLDDEDLDDEDVDDEFELVIQESPATRREAGRGKGSKLAAANKGPTKAPAKKTSAKKAPAAPAKKASAKKTSAKKAAPEPAKKPGKRKLTAVDVDDRMSLDQAAEFFMPYVEELGEATMQALEEQTGVSRRKLRFHVGQLVKHGLLERHGMGRGTYYTKL